MSNKKTVLIVKAILETLEETNGGPETMLYLPFEQSGLLDLNGFKAVLGSLQRSDLVKNERHFVTITAKGKQLVTDLNKALEGVI